jgi:tryptophan-rich sensory protein
MNLTDASRALRTRLHDFPETLPDRRGAFPPMTAGLLAVGAVGLAAVAAAMIESPRNSRSTERWYRNLEKPAATPPDFVFGIVWPAIESALAYSGFRLLGKPSTHTRNGALAFLGFNLANIPGYTKLFFGERNLKAASADSLALLVTSWAYVAATWRTDRTASLAGLPLALWVTFANYLQGEILRKNDPDVRQRAARMAGV